MEGATIHLAARTKNQMEEVSDCCVLVLFSHHLQIQPPFSVRQSLAMDTDSLRLLYAARPELKQAVSLSICTPLVALVQADTCNQSHLASSGTTQLTAISADSRMQLEFSCSSPSPPPFAVPCCLLLPRPHSSTRQDAPLLLAQEVVAFLSLKEAACNIGGRILQIQGGRRRLGSSNRSHRCLSHQPAGQDPAGAPSGALCSWPVFIHGCLGAVLGQAAEGAGQC